MINALPYVAVQPANHHVVINVHKADFSQVMIAVTFTYNLAVAHS